MRAVYDYTGEEEDELSFSAGDILYVVDSSDPDWWRARCKGQEGLVPSNMVENATSDGNTGPLHDAAKRGNIELLRECLSNRMPVNQADPAGNTALHWAARSGQLECLQELVGVVQIGMDKVNKLGDTPAMLAASHGHALCVEALLKVMSSSASLLLTFLFQLQSGADPKVKNKDGKNICDLAKDSDVMVVLKKFDVLQIISNGYDDEEYQNQDDDDDDDEYRLEN